MMRLILGCFGLRCLLGWCGGHVVTGIHDGWIWVGWQCHDCKCVKHYAPSRALAEGEE